MRFRTLFPTPSRGSRGLCVLAVVVGCLVFVPVSAGAPVERKPLELAKFTMQTTEKSNLVVINPEYPTFYRLDNVPYAFTQAGGHPWGLTTSVEFATEEVAIGGTTPPQKAVVPTQDPRDIVTDLPPGLLGNPNPQAFPRCPLSVVLTLAEHCPADTQLGVVKFRLYGNEGKETLAPIVNMTPEKGQSAEFGLETGFGVTVLLTAHVVRAGDTYGLTVVSNEIPMVELHEAELTFWGVPADPSHDPMRGLRCAAVGGKAIPGLECEGGDRSSGVPAVPFLTMPADCAAGPLTATVKADSWEEPGQFVEAHASLPAATGCNLLGFAPGVEVLPGSLLADAPVELGVSLKVPQDESPDGSATPQLRNTVLSLPSGLSISSGIVDGIQACNESGPEGINFTGPESEEIGLNGEPQLAPGHCPNASTVGTAKAFTPLLDEPVEGHVYLARPGCGGARQSACTEQDALDGNLYQLYLELGGVGPLADTGVNLKVHLRTEANPATGQLTTVAEDTPQLPFSKLEIHLNGRSSCAA